MGCGNKVVARVNAPLGKLYQYGLTNDSRIDRCSEQEDNEGHSSGILDISCHPQMLAIVTASSDGTAKVWNASGPLRRGPLTSSTSIHRTPVSGRRSRPGTQERISIAEERLAKQSKTNTNNNDELNGIDIPLDNVSNTV